MSGGLTTEVLERRVYLNSGELSVLYRLVDRHLDELGRANLRYVTEPVLRRIVDKLLKAQATRRRDR